ncbi:hypothetical protein ACWGCW_27500 [Streptomyces sp. NPDC054933]
MPGRRKRGTLAAALVGVLVGGIAWLTPSSAQALPHPAAEPGRHQTPGEASGGSPGTRVESVSVRRSDGRTAEFGVFSAPRTGADYLWYRTQAAPGGLYLPWSQVTTARINNQYPVLSAAEDGDGRLEVFTAEFQTTDVVRIHQSRPDGPWSAPTVFGPPSGAAIPFYFGYPYLYRTADGRLAYFAVYGDANGNALFTAEQSASGVWGRWTDLGAGPEPEPVGTPISVTESPDGRLTVVAHLWNASSGYYCEISQLAPGGPWGPWRTCATDGCR